MARRATSSPAAENPRAGSQLWLSASTPRFTAAPAAIARTANSPRPAMRDGRVSASGSAGGTVLIPRHGTHPAARYSSRSAAPASAAREIILDHELAEGTALGLEDPSAVAPADLLHEADQPRVVVEHEHVDGRTAARAPLDLGQRRGNRLGRGRPGEVGE